MTLSIVNVINTGGGAGSVQVVGNEAFVADALTGLQVLDIAAPAAPQSLGSFTLSNATTVLMSGQYAYVAEYATGIAVLDISNPLSIALDTTFSLTGNTAAPTELAAAGNYLFATEADAGAVRIIDVSDPSKPQLVTSYFISAPTAIATNGSYLYVGNAVGPGAELDILNIANPAAPVLIGTYKGSLSETAGIAIQGQYAYIVDEATGLTILDISNPAAPKVVEHYGAAFSAVQLEGSEAFLTGPDGVTELDVSNPSAPMLIASTNAPSEALNNIAVAGSYAYVADGALTVLAIGQLNQPPTILSVAASPSGGELGPGRTVTLTVNFNKAVTVDTTSGTPTLALNDGGTATYDAVATAALNDPTKVVFDYTVGRFGSRENTPDLALAATNAFQLNGAKITDATAGVAADLSGADGYNPAGVLIVNTISPIVTGVSAKVAGGGVEAGTGALVTITLSFNSAVTVRGRAPTLSLNDGGTAYFDAAATNRLHGPTKLVFEYTPIAGQSITDLRVASGLSSESIVDTARHPADLRNVSSFATGVHIDALRATVTGVSSTPDTGGIVTGQTATITVTMSEAVVVNGSPMLRLNDGGIATYDRKKANPSAGELVFEYTAGPGEKTIDLAATSIRGGSISDLGGTAADFGELSSFPIGIEVAPPPPTLAEYYNASWAVYQDNVATTGAPPQASTGLRVVLSSTDSTEPNHASWISDGFFAQAFEDNSGNVIIAFEGSDLNLLDRSEYAIGSRADDAKILAGDNPDSIPAMIDANQFASDVVHAFSKAQFI